jgi:large subunit ribosomal protein L16
MLVPKRAKFRKQQRGMMKGNATGGTTIAFGEFGLMSDGMDWVTARQIEAARKAITHYIKRGGKMWIRIFPDKPITKKPIEVRMGKGKGNVEYWVALVQPGRMLFELEGIPLIEAKEAFRLAAAKLPVKTEFVERVIK